MGGTTEVLDGKVEGDKNLLVETLNVHQDMEIRIAYSGQVASDDEIKFTRQVGEVRNRGRSLRPCQPGSLGPANSATTAGVRRISSNGYSPAT